MHIQISFISHFNNKWPCARISINEKIIFEGFCIGDDNDNFDVKAEVSDEYIKDINVLKIEHFDKKNNDTKEENGEIVKDRALELKSIGIDKISIPEIVLFNQKFYPLYPKNFFEDQNNAPPKFLTNNLYFGFNGHYIIEFKKDIRKWYFEKLLEKEMIANLNNQEFITLPNGNTIEVFEMSGKKLRSDKEENFTISDLYKMISKSDEK